MAKRKAKKTVKNPTESKKEPQIQAQQPQFMDHEIEVERQIGAIRAVRDVEIERLLIELRLIRSRFDEEQLQKPVLQVFEETLPNLCVTSDEGNKRFDVRWKERGWSRMSMNCCGDGRDDDAHVSFLQRLSMASIQPLGAFEYSSNAGRRSILGVENLHFKDIMEENTDLNYSCLHDLNSGEPSESQTLAMHEALQTPGVTSHRLSVGMTPKSLRLPKPGEMLLSVHGSPLGVFKENNMEAIHESEEG